MKIALFYLVGVVGLVGLYALLRAYANKREDLMGARWRAQNGVRRADYRIADDPEDTTKLEMLRRIARAQHKDR